MQASTTVDAAPRTARDAQRIERLVALSDPGHDAFHDVDWDGLDVDPHDPRLRLWDFDPLGHTAWYAGLPPDRQAEVGLLRTATNLRIGWEFENILQQGLLVRALGAANTDVAFRYLHTEVMEESQHTLMFWEFVRRHADAARGMPRWMVRSGTAMAHAAVRETPAFFWFMVLGGELPVDHLQRLAVRQGPERIHPLVERIMRIHVEEEARHVSFASDELRRCVPTLSAPARTALALAVPLLLAEMARLMVFPSRPLVAMLDVPRDDLRRALRRPGARALLADSCARIQRLCAELDLLPPSAEVLWRRLGIWSAERRSVGAVDGAARPTR